MGLVPCRHRALPPHAGLGDRSRVRGAGSALSLCLRAESVPASVRPDGDITPIVVAVAPRSVIDTASPAARDQLFPIGILGFAVTEAVALFALLVAFLILFT